MSTQTISKWIFPVLILAFIALQISTSSRELKPDEEKKLIKEHLIYELRKQDINHKHYFEQFLNDKCYNCKYFPLYYGGCVFERLTKQSNNGCNYSLYEKKI